MSEFTHPNPVLTDLTTIQHTYPSITNVTPISQSVIRPKFKLTLADGTYLDCEERGEFSLKLNNFWYNWFNSDHTLIMRFHNHGHEDGDPDDVLQFDPVHLHYKDGPLDNKGNIHDHSEFQSLDDVMNFIDMVGYVMKYKK